MKHHKIDTKLAVDSKSIAVPNISENPNTRKRKRSELENDSIKTIQNKEQPTMQKIWQCNPHIVLGKQPNIVLKLLSTDELKKYGVKVKVS